MSQFFHLTARPRVALILIVALLAAALVQAENLSVTIDAGDYHFVDVGDGEQKIAMEGFTNMLEPGKPALPARVVMVALPPGALVVSVTATGVGSVELSGAYNLAPAPPALPNVDDPDLVRRSYRTWQENHDAVYSSDEAYPGTAGEYLGDGALRKYAFARVAYFPFSYHPQTGRLVFTPAVNISIDYRTAVLDDQRAATLLSDGAADERASRLFINYPQAADWYRPVAARQSPEQAHDYVIVTTDALVAATSALATWKQSLGFDVNTVTVSWIQSNYTGTDLQQQIRNFLIDKYLEWGIEYVLLVGNIDVIPMRHCFPNATNHSTGSNENPPTDYYYADLTGNWDSDGDGFYGEYGEDAVDFVPEVIVGRIPYSDATSVASICGKLVAFEADTSPWKDNALLLAAMSNYANEDYMGWSRTDGAELMLEMISNVLPGWSYTTMYEKAGLNSCPYACDLPLTYSNVKLNWMANDYGIVNWWAHGGQYDAWRKWWAYDDGDGTPEAGEMSWESFCATSDVGLLDNDHPSIVFSCSCNNGWPEVNNLARSLLLSGSAGIVASTRISWYTIGWDYWHGGNASIDYDFFRYLITDEENMGQALFDSKLYYLSNYFWWEWQSQANMFDFCLYGDPAMVYKGVVGGCCTGIRGNVNNDPDDKVNISDVGYLLSFLFGTPTGPGPVCWEEGNANGDPDEKVNVSDVGYLLAFLFGTPTGPEPKPCP